MCERWEGECTHLLTMPIMLEDESIAPDIAACQDCAAILLRDEENEL